LSSGEGVAHHARRSCSCGSFGRTFSMFFHAGSIFWAYLPLLRALHRERALPSAVRGPVDLRALARLIAARSAGVQRVVRFADFVGCGEKKSGLSVMKYPVSSDKAMQDMMASGVEDEGV